MGGVWMGPFDGLSTRVGVGGLASLLLAALAFTSPPPADAVTGGARIPITDAPWQVEIVSFGSSGFPYCGGAILSDRLVLTAAHCVVGSFHTTLVAGASDYNGEGPEQQSDQVKSMRIDPSFRAQSGSEPSPDDVAVLELETPLTFGTGAVEPIGLAPPGSDFPAGTTVELTGYGQRQAGAESPLNEALYSLTTKLVSSSGCGGEAVPVRCHVRRHYLRRRQWQRADIAGGARDAHRPRRQGGTHLGETCSAGSKDVFVNLAERDIQQFIGTSRLGGRAHRLLRPVREYQRGSDPRCGWPRPS